MKKLILILLAILGTFLNKTKAQITFQKSYGATYMVGNPETNNASVLQTYDGGYCVGMTIDGNNGDIYLMKLNPVGDTLWTKTFGGNFDDILYSVEQTSDSGFILSGWTRSFSMGNSDAFIIKTDSNGDLVWSKHFGGFDFDWFSSIQQTNDKGFIACGTTQSFGSGIQDVYLVKTDSVGNLQWTKTIGGSGWDRGTSVRQTFDRGFIITGYTTSFSAASGRIYLIKTDSIGNPVWSNIFGGVMGESGNCVRQCSDSGYIITGYTNSFGAGSQDVFLLKTDTGGNFNWMKTYGGGLWEDIGYQVEQTTDSGFVVVGRTQNFEPNLGSEIKVYLIKTNPDGDTLWTKIYGSIINNGYSVKQTNDGGYIIASSPPNLQVIKTDSSGFTGCNEYNTNTIVNSVSPVITTGDLTDSGGAEMDAAMIPRYTPISITECIKIAPVGLIQFKVTASDCRKIDLIWETAHETNNKGFEIQYSLDGYQFKKIAFIPGIGNSNNSKTYHYSVPNFQGRTIYFKLKQIDFDGHFKYSPIVLFKNNCNNNSISIFPNPVKNTFQIRGLPTDKNTIEIINVFGSQVALWGKSSQLNFNINNLPSGIYLLRINNNISYTILKD